MRITDRMVVNRTLRNLRQGRRRLGEAQTKVATGRRLLRPSDDPADVERAMMLASEIRTNDKQISNMAMTRDWLHATDQAITDLNDLMENARNLALTALNDTNGQLEREAIAEQVGGMLEAAISIANSQSGEYYIFSGHKLRTKPFEIDNTNTIVYNGDNNTFEHYVEPGQRMPVNFTGVSGNNGGILNALTNLQNLQQAIASGDRNQIENFVSASDDIKSDMNSIQSAVGARVRRVDNTSSRLQQRQVDLRQLFSQLVDADMAETIAEMSAEDRAYELSLAAASRVLPRSLLDFLR